MQSRPSRARGSKHPRVTSPDTADGRALHGRADRNATGADRAARLRVAPFTGARIETSTSHDAAEAADAGRALHGRADRNNRAMTVHGDRARRALHGRADRNRSAGLGLAIAASRPSRARGSKHRRCRRRCHRGRSRPSRARGSKRLIAGAIAASDCRALHGRADRNRRMLADGVTSISVAPFTGARIETRSG